MFGVELDAPSAVPGKLPHGEPLGVVPGFVVVLGLTVEGCVGVPGVGGFGEFEPGTACGVAVPAGGVAVLAGGVAVSAGGVAALAGGVAVPAGGVAVPAGGVAVPIGGVAVPAGGVAVLAGGVAVVAGGAAVRAGGVAGEPAVDLWAKDQLAQHSTIESNVSFRDNIFRTSRDENRLSATSL